jgi:hypothetical protein
VFRRGLDGLQQNQPFGDVVSWDLIQHNAISEIRCHRDRIGYSDSNTLGTEAAYGGSHANGLQIGSQPANIFHESG